MKKTFYLLFISALSVLAYLVAYAVKRHLFPASYVLEEAVVLTAISLPILIWFLIVLRQRGILLFDGAVAVCLIFLLSCLCFTLTVPAIFDRSITLYLLNALDNRSDGMMEEEVKEAFLSIYFNRNYAIKKRLDEQVQSGHVRYAGDRYHITESGRQIMTVARVLSAIYNLDDRIVEKRKQEASGSVKK